MVVCVCVCVCVCGCVCVCVCVVVCVCVCVCLHECVYVCANMYLSVFVCLCACVCVIVFRDWSLFTGRGGGLQNGKIAGPKHFATPPQDRVKLFAPPLLKSGNFSRCPYNMAKTSSYRLKTTPKLFVPPLQHA